jgi:general secretion pathway protein G
MKKRSGFTLVEILIVVVILGILAAIVIPQFSDASEQAKDATLVSDLQTVRSQIQLYKLHHNAKLPGVTGGAGFIDAMTKYTDVDGKLATTQAPGGGFGPYLLKMPDNPYKPLESDANEVSLGTGNPPGDNSSGWYFNTTTGAFNANDSAAHAAK